MTLDEQIDHIFDLIEVRDWKLAEKESRDLIEEGHWEGYDLLANIFASQEEMDQTVVLLEEGVEVFPQSWTLWMRLGNYQSDLEEYEEAEYALKRAEYLTDADVELIRLNLAILYGRTGRFEEAFVLLEQTKEQYPLASLEASFYLLDEQEDSASVISAFEAFVFPEEEDEEELEENTISGIYYYLAKAYWRTEELALAQDALGLALHWDRTNRRALWLKISMEGTIAEENKYYEIIIQGDWFEEGENGEKFKFLTSYQVVARDMEEALSLIKAFEPIPLNLDSFQVEEWEELQNYPENPTGIYWTGDFWTYEEGEEIR